MDTIAQSGKKQIICYKLKGCYPNSDNCLCTRNQSGIRCSRNIPIKRYLADASHIQPKGIYTFNRQFVVEVSLRRLGPNNQTLLIGYASFKHFPEYFFGLGNNTQDSMQQLIDTRSM